MSEKETLRLKAEIHNSPPADRLMEIYDMMRKHPSLRTLPSVVAEALQNKPSDLSKFKFNIGKQKWSGVLYHSRNSLYGTIFSYFGKTPIIIRGMPKIKYSEVSKVLENPCNIEEKVDGTNIIVWTFPDGTFWGKTRETPSIFGEGHGGQHWAELLEETGEIEKLKALCDEGYEVVTELYGYKNKCEFITYTVSIAIKVLEICDRKTFKFVSPEKKIELCKKYDLPLVGVYNTTTLTPKELERLEYEAKALVKDDGFEGFVAKYFDPETKDVHMGKIKCEEIRRLCYGNKIPMREVYKAVRKCTEANISLLMEDGKTVNPNAVEFVKNELLEDWEEASVSHSSNKILCALKNPKDEAVDISAFEVEEVSRMLDELAAKGMEISLDNKGKILSIVGTAILGVQGGRLFKAFLAYLDKKEKEGN